MHKQQLFDKRAFLALTILSVLAFLGNYLRYELFFNVDIIFGGVFTILAIRIYGYYGIVVGAIASVQTYFLWNHPYAIIILTAEAAFVANYREKFNNTVLTDVLYWLLLGMPLVLFIYHLVMGMELDSVFLVMMKQSINGIVAALIASVIYDVYRYFLMSDKNRKIAISYQHMIFQTLITVIFIPLMLYVMTSVKTNNEFMTERIYKELGSVTQSTKIYIRDFTSDSLHVLGLLEGISFNHYFINDEKTKLIDEYSKIKDTHPYIENISLLDKDLNYIACTDKHESERVEATKAFTDDERWGLYDPYISGITKVHSEADAKNGIFMLNSVTDSDGTRMGYVRIDIDSNYMKNKLLEMTEGSGVFVTLLDRSKKVIMSTSDNYTVGGSWTDRNELGKVEILSKDVQLFTPKPKANTSIMKRWVGSLYSQTQNVDAYSGFVLKSDMPATLLVKHMYNQGRKALVIMFFMIIISVSFAYWLSIRITRQIAIVSEKTKHIPDKISRGEEINWPNSNVKEAVEIQDNFIAMINELKTIFDEMKNQKQNIEIMLDSIPMAIMMKDTDNRIISLNQMAATNFQMSKEKLIGAKVDDLFNGGNYFEEDKEVIRTKKAKVNVITGYHHKAGKIFTARTTRTPIFNKSGDVDSVLVIIDDITEELKRNEEREKMLKTMNKQARMAEVGALMNIIIHQWKQPLNVTSLVVQNIKDDIEDDTLSKEQLLNDIETLLQNNNFMAQTITDFVGYYKNSKHKTLFKVGDVVKEVCDLLNKQVSKNKVHLTIENCEEDFEINNLKNEFKQVCLNLINNANEALSEAVVDDRQLTIRFQAGKEEGRIMIIDNGGGIPSHLLPDTIFEPYVTTKGDGSGIGLSVCKDIIEVHMGGSISACNENGGAKFIVTLPYNVKD